MLEYTPERRLENQKNRYLQNISTIERQNMDEPPSHDRREPHSLHSLPLASIDSVDGVVSDESQNSKYAGFLPSRDNPQAWKAGKKCKKPFCALLPMTCMFLERRKLKAKGRCTAIVVAMTATIAFCSSIYTAAIESIADRYGCSRLVSTLGVTTFLLGFAIGPLFFAPLSEVWSVRLYFAPCLFESLIDLPGGETTYSELLCFFLFYPK